MEGVRVRILASGPIPCLFMLLASLRKVLFMRPKSTVFNRGLRYSVMLITALLALQTTSRVAAASPATLQESSQSDSKPTSTSKPMSTEQLQQLAAPIALYPDSLLAQILMASTYPLEIVEAARWVKANPGLESKALESAMQKQSWDPSVKSLTAFPQVLDMMNDKLTWTTQLGNAFLANQKGVMDAVQVLRKKAKEEGNLKTNKQQEVAVQQGSGGDQADVIVITPADPQIVYVPTYNPTVVYGTWAYPAYPPYYWYPPGYVATRSAISFGAGLVVGAALWGNCNWGRSNVNINVNRYNSFNRTQINSANWNHNSSHRGGVSYGNKNLQNRFGTNQARDAKARDSFRGYADRGRQQLSNGSADRFKGSNAEGRVGAASNRVESGLGSRGMSSMGNELGGLRGSSSGARESALGGISRGQRSLRSSDRGFQSRSGRGSFGGMSRGGGGGGHRGFGGMRGGGRRR